MFGRVCIGRKLAGNEILRMRMCTDFSVEHFINIFLHRSLMISNASATNLKLAMVTVLLPGCIYFQSEKKLKSVEETKNKFIDIP